MFSLNMTNIYSSAVFAELLCDLILFRLDNMISFPLVVKIVPIYQNLTLAL